MAEKLAIYKDLPQIRQLIYKNMVSWVIIPTGSGKSIGIPYDLIHNGARVMCTQPTIPAATSLFEYQKKLSPEFKIGYAAEGTVNYGKDTVCVYCTAGHTRKVMKGHFKAGKASPMTFTDVLLVDECHTGSKDNSIIIDLWLEARRQGVKVPRLVLSTATEFGCQFLMDRLAETIDKTGKVTKSEPKVFRSEFRHNKVEVRYQKKNYESPDSDELFEDAAKVALDLLLEKKSHGIVFASGSAEVEEIVYELNELIERRQVRKGLNKPLKVLPCYGQCKREEIEEAICDEKEQQNPCIKIVVGTNLVETSLTVPDVAWIVDTLSEKRSDIISGRFHLGTTRISKNSADQRKGRTGRTVNNGVCHRMCSQEIYNTFEDFRPLEITRTPISDIIIECLTCGLDPVRVIHDLESRKIEEAKQTLVETGCIIIEGVSGGNGMEWKMGTEKGNGKIGKWGDVLEGKTSKEKYNEAFPSLSKKVEQKEEPAFSAKVTEVGYFVAEMPMDTRNAAALYDYLVESTQDNDFWGIAAFVIADIFGPSQLYFPRREKNEKPKDYRLRLELYAFKYFREFTGSNPLESLMLTLEACLSTHPDLGLDTPFWKLRDWAVTNSCNNKKLRETIIQIKRVGKIFHNIRIKRKKDIKPSKVLCEYDGKADNKKIIRSVTGDVVKSFYKMYKSKVLKSHGFKYISPDGRLVNVDTNKTVSFRGPGSSVIPLSEVHIKGKDSEQIIVSLWIDCSMLAMADAAESFRAMRLLAEGAGSSRSEISSGWMIYAHSRASSSSSSDDSW